MKHIEPYLIPELKARIDNQYGVALDNVFGCEIPVLVEFEYDRDEDEPPQVRQMVVKAAQDWTLGADFFELVIKQGADITQMLDVQAESKVEQAMLDRMEARAKEALSEAAEAYIDQEMEARAERGGDTWIKF